MADHPQEFMDTSPEMMDAWVEIIRRKTPEERIAMTFQLSEFAMRMAEAGMRERHPDADDREIFLRCASLRLSRDLMVKVYGCDPAERGWAFVESPETT